MLRNSSPVVFACLAAYCLVLLTPVASIAAPIQFVGKGWKIEMPSWVDGPGAGIFLDPSDASAGPGMLIIQVSKIFRGSPGFGGTMPVVTLSFTQITGVSDADTATTIVINNETVKNETTVDWMGFDFGLTSDGFGSFDRAHDFTDAADGFSTGTYYDVSGGSEGYALTDGLVRSGDTFYPGSLSGELVVDVDLKDPSGPTAYFTISETPTIPEPGVAILLGLGGLVMIVRRRRRSAA